MATQTKHSYQLDVTINWRDKPNSVSNIESVERSLSYNGKKEYSDKLDFDKWDRSLQNPDVFRIVELFSMGAIPLSSMYRKGDRCVWNLQGERKGWERPSLMKRIIRWLRRNHLWSK